MRNQFRLWVTFLCLVGCFVLVGCQSQNASASLPLVEFPLTAEEVTKALKEADFP